MVEQLLNRETVRSRTYYLVLWQGASADGTWEPAEHLANCQERIAEYEAAALFRPALRAHKRAGPAPFAPAAASPAPAPPPPAAAPGPAHPPPPGCQ